MGHSHLGTEWWACIKCQQENVSLVGDDKICWKCEAVWTTFCRDCGAAIHMKGHGIAYYCKKCEQEHG